VYEIFKELEEGFVESGFICETCGLVAISNQNGELKVIRVSEDTHSQAEWENY